MLDKSALSEEESCDEGAIEPGGAPESVLIGSMLQIPVVLFLLPCLISCSKCSFASSALLSGTLSSLRSVLRLACDEGFDSFFARRDESKARMLGFGSVAVKLGTLCICFDVLSCQYW